MVVKLPVSHGHDGAAQLVQYFSLPWFWYKLVLVHILFPIDMPTTAATYDEQSILVLVANGQRAAFTRLYATHLTALYKYVFLFTHSKVETEEILQEIFIKVWEQRDKLPAIASFKDYLFRMAKNKLIDTIRHQQIRRKALAEIRRTAQDREATTANQCDYRAYYQVVQKAMEQLPPKRKLIFRMTIENGLSQEEIASQLKISRSVVNKQLYSASRFVRQYLFEHTEISIPLLLLLFSCSS